MERLDLLVAYMSTSELKD